MRISLLAIAKTTDKHLDALIQDYTSRLTHYCSFAFKVLEAKVTASMSEAEQKTIEGALLLQHIPATADCILLDEHGTQYRSVDFAAMVQKKMAAGRDLVFVIGGPYGFSEAVYQRANGKMSLSEMTFSHQMVRLFFVEQLYRAFTILRGEKYHHE